MIVLVNKKHLQWKKHTSSVLNIYVQTFLYTLTHETIQLYIFPRQSCRQA